MPNDWQDDMASISAPVDWLGLNYYTRKLISPGPGGLFGDFTESVADLPQTSMGWEIYPQGIHHFLTRVSRDYAAGLPIYITENGMSGPDPLLNGAVQR